MAVIIWAQSAKHWQLKLDVTDGLPATTHFLRIYTITKAHCVRIFT